MGWHVKQPNPVFSFLIGLGLVAELTVLFAPPVWFTGAPVATYTLIHLVAFVSLVVGTIGEFRLARQ